MKADPKLGLYFHQIAVYGMLKGWLYSYAISTKISCAGTNIDFPVLLLSTESLQRGSEG